jgi:bifunctional oligoribonuclease and PAP phosphatase NrnA
MNNIDQIIESIKGSNDFVITSHCSPDGDNIGSSLGMYYSLKKLGKNVVYVLDDTIPLNLKFLTKDIKIYNSDDMFNKDYVLIALDCGDRSRLCCKDHIVKNSTNLICIDHHASNDAYGDLNYIDIDASSTCELVYNLLNEICTECDTSIIDEKIATCLYTGLVTDTGNFSYSNTNPSSFLMAYNLSKLGANRDEVIQNIYQNNPVSYYKLLGEALNTLEIIDEKVSCITLSLDMLDRNNIEFNDVDGITTYTRDIEGVEVGLLFKQKGTNEVKVSFRSKNYVNVSKIAQKFNGGGHIRAAGCTIKDNLESAKNMVIKEVLNHI